MKRHISRGGPKGLAAGPTRIPSLLVWLPYRSTSGARRCGRALQGETPVRCTPLADRVLCIRRSSNLPIKRIREPGFCEGVEIAIHFSPSRQSAPSMAGVPSTVSKRASVPTRGIASRFRPAQPLLSITSLFSHARPPLLLLTETGKEESQDHFC